MESNKKSIGQLFKRPIFLLVFFTIISLLMSFSAMLVQNAGFSVQVTKGVVNMDTFYQERYGGVAPNHRPLRLSLAGKDYDGMLNAKMAYQLYMPKGVSKDNPVPAIALTHGYLNSKEYEEAPAIELARRGYVVFAFDQYDHGDSTWDTPNQYFGSFDFFIWSAYDAVEYLYSQDYVLKDADGNGMIAVSGHSMGGFSSEVATGLDEINYVSGVKPYRMLAGALAVGADFSYCNPIISAFSGGHYQSTYLAYNNRTVGTVQGVYDEFFFDSESGGGTVHKKDFLSDPVGLAMLGFNPLTAPSSGENGRFYQIEPQDATNVQVATEYIDLSANYGERVIYKVAGDHPYNTWSPEATSCMVDFYNHCFSHQLLSHELQPLDTYVRVMDGSHQIWWLKEVFTCLGMIALFGMILMGLFAMNSIPVVGKWSISRNSANVGAIAMDKPRDVKTKKIKKEKEVTPKPVKPVNKTRRGIGIVLTIFTILLSAWLIPSFMDRSGLSGTTDFVSSQALIIIVTIILSLAMALAFVLGVIMIVFKATKKDFDQKKLVRPLVGSLIISALTWAMRWVITDGTKVILGSTDRWFNAPSVNTIAYWAVASGLLALIFTLIQHFYVHEDRDISHLGLKASWKNVGGSLLNAIVVAGVTCGFIWLVNVIFKTDFRVYTYAFKTVNGVAFVSSLRYLPIFFIFYLCAGIGVASATVGKKGWKADLLAIAIEAGPTILFLIYQYGMLLATGTAPFANFALNGILVQGLVITLVVMAVWQRRSLEKTGNIWSGVFLNTIIFTFITVANTTLYLLK